MSATEYVKSKLDKIRPHAKETVDELAERMYNCQSNAYTEYAGFAIAPAQDFLFLPKATKDLWRSKASQLLNSVIKGKNNG